MINEPYLNEEGRVEHPALPDDYDKVMQNACDHWDNSNDTKDAYYHDDNMGLHTGGSLEQKYDNYHSMAMSCGEEPVGYDEWLNT